MVQYMRFLLPYASVCLPVIQSLGALYYNDHIIIIIIYQNKNVKIIIIFHY